MAAMFNEGDVAYLQSLYPELEIKLPTGQQEKLLTLYFRGQSVKESSKTAGYKSATAARNFLRSETGIVMLQFLKEREFNDIRVDRESLTSMFFEAYNLAATSTEMIAATRELGKLHGIYPDAKTLGIQINADLSPGNEQSIKKLMQLTDAQLAELAGPGMRELLPDGPVVIEQEVVLVSEESE